jgi:hypothetical protein
VKIHLAGKKSTGPKFAGPYAVQHGIAHLQVQGSSLKFCAFVHCMFPRI